MNWDSFCGFTVERMITCCWVVPRFNLSGEIPIVGVSAKEVEGGFAVSMKVWMPNNWFRSFLPCYTLGFELESSLEPVDLIG